MKVILQKDVPNLGDAGEIKEVAAGYARNFLIPRKLVVAAIGGSTKAAEHQKKQMALRAEKRHNEMADVSEKLKALGTIEVQVRVGAKGKLFGSVTSLTISQALTDAGFTVDKRKVELSDSIKSTGTYQVKVKLAEKISVPLTISVVPDEESVRTLEQEEKEEAARKAREEAIQQRIAGVEEPASTEATDTDAPAEEEATAEASESTESEEA